MTTQIYVVKYIQDSRRWEPKNVGLIVTSDDAHASRFLGEQPSGDVHKTGVVNIVNDTDIYIDWVNYFRRTLTAGEQGITKIMNETDGNYLVMRAGEVWQGTTDPQVVVDEYFPKLVKAYRSAEEGLEDHVEGLFERAGIATSPHLERGATIDSAIERSDGKPVQFNFHYHWANGQELVGERLTFKRPDWTRGQLWKFSKIREDITKIAFVSSEASASGLDLEAELEEVPAKEIIDVANKRALKRILALFNDTRP